MTISHTPLSMESIQFKQQYLDMLNSTPGERVMVNQGVAIETVVGTGSRLDLLSFGFQKLTQNSVVGSKLPFPPNGLITESCWS